MRNLFFDLRYGFRTLLRNPSFSIAAALLLALGIGANTAIFSVVNAVILRPLGYPRPDQLVYISSQFPALGFDQFWVSAPEFLEFRERNASFEDVGAYRAGAVNLGTQDQPRRVVSAVVTSELMPVLGVSPRIGRWITSDDDKQGSHVVVLSYGLWARAFGQDPSVVGRAIALDRQPYTVVGVMPAPFEFPPRGAALNGEPAEVFIPMSFSRVEREGFGMRYNTTVIGRIKPGVRLEQARAEATTIASLAASRIAPCLASLSAPARYIRHVR